MNTNLQVFNFESHSIRTVMLDSVINFGSRDVAVALDYADPSKAYTHCKSLKKLSYAELAELGWDNPNRQGEYVMPESDVFRMIMKSNKPQAEKFQDWVVEEVLPSIRKTGSYNINNNQTPQISLTPYEIAGKQFETEYKIWNLLECPVHISQQEIVKSVRKNTGIDFGEALKYAAAQQNIPQKDVMLEPTEIGIKFGLGKGKVAGAKANRLLALHGFQTKVNDEWVPTTLGEPHCQKHAWAVKNKSGYNLKWNIDFLENYFNNISVDEEVEDESDTDSDD